MTRIARVLTLVLVILLVCAAGPTACAPANEVVLAATPSPTPTTTAAPTATPEPTPSPTPTSEPTPTPMPELTYDQKKLLLGINSSFTPTNLYNHMLFDYALNGQDGRFCTLAYQDREAEAENEGYMILNFYTTFDRNKGYLFTISVPLDPETGRPIVSLGEQISYITEVSPALEGMQPKNLMTMCQAAFYYDIKGIDYNNNETLTKWSNVFLSMNMDDVNKLTETIISTDELVKVFLDSTDQEKIKPFWEYTPGATVPDGLKEFYPNAIPMPEGAETSISYIAPTS